MKIYAIIGAIIVLSVIAFAIDRNGYNRCQAQHAKAVANKRIEQAKAVGKIKEKAAEAKKERKKYVEEVQDIVSPCATTLVPIDRAERVRKFYRSQAGRRPN
jgi:hypothetical protein